MSTRSIKRTSFAAVLGWSLAAASPAQQASPETNAVDPRAEAVVLDWIEAPRAAQNTRAVVSDSIERVNDQGQSILYTHQRTFSASGRDHLRVESRGDLVNRDLIFDGALVTVHDLDRQLYAQVPFEGTYSDMIDMLDRRYGLTTPLADLLQDNRRAVLEGVQTGTYVGESPVGGHLCHHVAFTRDDIDWQGWFDTQDRTVLRRFAVSFKTEPAAPCYVATLISVEHPEDLPPDTFTFDPPAGASPIEVAPIDASPEASAQN